LPLTRYTFPTRRSSDLEWKVSQYLPHPLSFSTMTRPHLQVYDLRPVGQSHQATTNRNRQTAMMPLTSNFVATQTPVNSAVTSLTPPPCRRLRSTSAGGVLRVGGRELRTLFHLGRH